MNSKPKGLLEHNNQGQARVGGSIPDKSFVV